MLALLEETRVSCQALLGFGHSTDEDFTALAQGLAELTGRLTELRNQTESFRAVLEDRDHERPIASAYGLYKNSVDLVHASMGIAVSEQQQMVEIEEALLHACKARDQFRRNHMLLGILTMSIRMEASRVDADFQSVFLNVAAAIAEIDTRIATSTETAFERIETVVAEACLQRGELKHLETHLHQRAQTSIQRIQRELTTLKETLAPCAAQSESISAQFAQIAPRTLQIIGALQHQDIVRQQLEHVAAGFQDLEQHLHDGARAAAEGRRTVELGYVHHAALVQKAHLRAARDEFATAADEVVGGLKSILDDGTALVERFAEMEKAGTAAFTDCHVATMFREEIQQLTRIADRSKDANDKLSRLVERIGEVVGVFSREVGHHELDVKIVALNAQIAAARAPSAEALNKLAEETSLISDANALVTRELTGNLQAGLEKLTSVKRDADEFLVIVAREKEDLETGVGTVSGRLVRLTERVQSTSAQVRRDFEIAQREGQALLASLSFFDQIAVSFDPAEQLCERLLAATAQYASAEDLSAEASARLEAHCERYTMHKENATHAAAINRGASAPVAAAGGEPELFFAEPPTGSNDPAPPAPLSHEADSAPSAPPPSAASDLGEGIELF